MKRIFLILLWAILFILGIDLALGWLNMANTIANIAGVFTVLIIVCISYKTRCFTNFKFIKK